jgi:hypothetical protein
MNFQHMKISACGHELGSSILFGSRIGFSGTPSNLLPVDLGDCKYEPGSDGQIVSVLTSNKVTDAEIKQAWSARSLLRDIATAASPYHALIDTGALITGMDNLEVARFMLLHLPASLFDGVVYLDRQDRQMILLRDSMRSTLLAQCGMPWHRRFTFYDQVHTTGTRHTAHMRTTFERILCPRLPCAHSCVLTSCAQVWTSSRPRTRARW